MKSVYVVVPVNKHLQGQHDQSSHGIWAAGKRSDKEKSVQARISNVKIEKITPEESLLAESRVTAEYKTPSGQTVYLTHDNAKKQNLRFKSLQEIEMETIAEVDVEGGRAQIASMYSGGYAHREATITGISVSPEYQRQGVATAMLNLARRYSQDGVKIEHSFSLTEDSIAWSAVVKHLAGQHDQSSHGNWSGSPKLTILNEKGSENEFLNQSLRVVRYEEKGKNPVDYVLFADGKYKIIVAPKPTDGTNFTGYRGIESKGVGVLIAEGPKASHLRLTSGLDNYFTVNQIAVKPSHQRRGLASAMLQFHRDMYPEANIQHSDALTEDGKSWATVVKHLAGQHDQSSHGKWAKRPYIGHEFTDTDGVKVTVQFHNLKQKLTEKQKKEFRTIIYDLKTKTDLTGLDEVKVFISDYDPDFNNDKGQRGNTETLFDEDTGKLTSEINIRGEDLLRTTFNTREQNAWMKRSTTGTVTSVAEYLMAHEWGHVISHHRETSFIVGRSDMAMARRKNLVHDLLWQNKNDLSGYGRTSHGEGYAEAYADWFMNDGNNSPVWMDELAKVDSWQK